MKPTTFLASVSSFALFACAGPNAAGPDKDPWAGYQGTHAASPRGAAATTNAGASEPRDAVESEAEEAVATPEPKARAKAKTAPPPSATPSKATIRTASVSSIDVDALGEATAGSLGAKIVSTDLVVGAAYELVEVQLTGATVQIVRAASAPDAGGPELITPRERQSALSPTEAAWYDDAADVLVVVNSAKKSTSQKLLDKLVTKR